MIVELLLAGDERISVGRSAEEPPAVLVCEQGDPEERQPPRLLQPPQLACRDVQLVEPVRDVGVVLEKRVRVRASCTPRSKQLPVRLGQGAEQELAEPSRCDDDVVALETASRLRECSEREPVPRREHLVVACRLRPLLPQSEQPLPCLAVELAADDEPAVLERLQ